MSPLTGREMTMIFAASLIILGVAWDLMSFYVVGNDYTISRVFLWIDTNARIFGYIVVFAFGLLCGHLFVPQHVAVVAQKMFGSRP